MAVSEPFGYRDKEINRVSACNKTCLMGVLRLSCG